MSISNMARLEVGTLLGILVNTIPTMFYMLYFIFSDDSLLKEARTEVEACVTSSDKQGDELSLDTTKIRDECPLLFSIFQEVLRYYSRGATARLVVEDTMLNGRFLLKKNAVVLMPTFVIHTDPLAWDPSEFNPRRFVKGEGGVKRSSAASYRPFGGGSTLCPGRYFATAEVLDLTAMLVHQYEVKPVSGEWKLPAAVQPNLAVNIFPPRTDAMVRMTPRKGLEAAEWVFDTVRTS